MSKSPHYPVPFRVGAKYEALQDILGHFDRILKGEQLEYIDTGFSRYDGYIGFFFTGPTGEVRRWDIYEDEDPSALAAKLFVEVARNAGQ